MSGHSAFFDIVGRPIIGDEVFDHISDIVYFVKDFGCRYVAVSSTLVERSGCDQKVEVLGKTAEEVFRSTLGERFTQQDQEVIESGEPIRGELELHLYPDGNEGWCLTWKEPIVGRLGRVVGLCGVSRDLKSGDIDSDLSHVALVLRHVRENLDQSLQVEELASIAEMSQFQLDQRIKSLFGVSTSQFITRSRIELACNKLRRTTDSIASIAQLCGYSDASAFTRQFRKTVGMTPSIFRDQIHLK